MKISLTNKCPNCGSSERKRMMGMGFWQNLPGTKKFECEECFTDYLVVFGIFNFLILQGQFFKKKRENQFSLWLMRFIKYAIVISLAIFIFQNFHKIKRRVIILLRGPVNNEMQYFIESTKDKVLTTTEDEVLKKEITDLFKRAEKQILENKFYFPENDNAWQTYTEVLKVDPNWNENAIEGLRLVKEEVKRREKDQDINAQVQLYQLEKERRVKEKLETYKKNIEEESKLTKEDIERKAKEREQQIAEQKKRQEELEKQRKFQKQIDDFWYTLDMSWEKIFAKKIGKERIVKTDVPQIFNITELTITDTPIKNLDPLSFLPNLKSLSCSKTGVYSLQPLSKASELTYLDCSRNNIKSLQSLNMLTKLTYLNCSHNEIDLLDPVKNNIDMKVLDISNTKVMTLSRTQNFRELEELNIGFTDIRSLSELNSTNLTKLSLPETRITDLGVLSHQKKLVYLDCSHNDIEDISPLKSLQQLTYLDVSYTLIKTIRPIRSLINLKTLNCSGTTIEKISYIENMTKLEELYCNCYYLSGLEAFENLKNLTTVVVNRNTFTNAFEEAHPNVKISKKF